MSPRFHHLHPCPLTHPISPSKLAIQVRIDLSLRRDKSTPVRLQQPHSAETQHTGLLLVALPSLLDPSFRRTILFLTHHDQEGAMGFILNRPRHESLGELAESPMDLAAVPVFEGGPVERQNLILTLLLWKGTGVHFQSLGEEDLAQLDHKEGSKEDQDDAPAHDQHQNLRAFTGYAGWTAGQLEQEIAEQSWHLLKPTAEMLRPVLTTEDGIKRWKMVMKELGAMYYLLSQAPDDPKLN
jgi:putative transcriptional regulator